MRNRLPSSAELTGRLEQLHDTSPLSIASEQAYLEQQTCLFGPERYEPRYNYPLIVWLHSCHSAELELEQVMPELSLQNYVACAPRGTTACDPEGRRYRWGRSAASTAIAEELVFDSIELACAKFSIARNKIFLAGFGSGASMAWRVALRYPKRFAGVVSICGQFPAQQRVLSNLADARELPSLWMYGAESTNCGVSHICDSLPVMHSASLQVAIRQYPCGDELRSNMLFDVNSWLMERVTNQPANFETSFEESFSKN
jgi:phospholipase/carboxylesterase